MKKNLLYLITVVSFYLIGGIASAQANLAPDQNPGYSTSRDKYMKLVDSLTDWEGTTLQDRYKAIDWLVDRQEARTDRREFRRQLRMERAKWSGYSYYDDGYYPSDNYYYRNSNNNNYRYNQYRRNRSYGVSPWYGLNFWWR